MKKAIMKTTKHNIFDIPADLRVDEEFFETLASAEGLRIERIISHGQTTPKGQWYDQGEDEWVILLQGEASLQWEDGSQSRLSAGDWVFIPAHRRHRVSNTTEKPPCVWLAIHITTTTSKS